MFNRATAFYVYDYLLNFSCEIDLIWRSKFQLGAVFYLVARYMPVLTLMYTLTLDVAESLPS